MGRPRNPLTVSGTGYTVNTASQLRYKKQCKNGSYEIDTDAIKNAVNSYITEHTDENGNITTPISEPGLMAALGIANRETYTLWLRGYVHRDHMHDERMTCNTALADALSQGQRRIAQYLMEQESGKYMSRIRERQLETMGYLAPTKIASDMTVKLVTGKWQRRAK